MDVQEAYQFARDYLKMSRTPAEIEHIIAGYDAPWPVDKPDPAYALPGQLIAADIRKRVAAAFPQDNADAVISEQEQVEEDGRTTEAIGTAEEKQDTGTEAASDMLSAEISEAASGENVARHPAMKFTVVEMCAGTGGMARQIASDLGELAEVTAWEISKKNVMESRALRDAQGLQNLTIVEKDARRATSADAFDYILIDPPSTCTGSVRRDAPERFKSLDGYNLIVWKTLQHALLECGLTMMHVGSVLIYTTESLLRLENEDVVRQALVRSVRLGTYELETIELPENHPFELLPSKIEQAVCICPTDQTNGRFIVKITRTA